MIKEIEYTLSDGHGNRITNKKVAAGAAVLDIARYVLRSATDPDMDGQGAHSGAIQFRPGPNIVPVSSPEPEDVLNDIEKLIGPVDDIDNDTDIDFLRGRLKEVRNTVSAYWARTCDLGRDEPLLFGQVLDHAKQLASGNADYNLALIDLCLRVGGLSDISRDLVEHAIGIKQCPATT